jgi:hypothetical protein
MNQTKTIAENMQYFAEKLSKQCEELILLNGTKLDQISSPETYSNESIEETTKRFKNALKSILDTVTEIDDHCDILQSEPEPETQSEIFKQMAEIFRPINSQNFNF